MLPRLAVALALVSVIGCSSGGASSAPPLPVSSPCATDADCRACPIDQCGCAPSVGSCPPTMVECVADPCGARAAICRAGACALVPRPAAP